MNTIHYIKHTFNKLEFKIYLYRLIDVIHLFSSLYIIYIIPPPNIIYLIYIIIKIT
jgi:hypothetical protein